MGELLLVFAQRVGTKKNSKDGKCPFLQPGSHMTLIRRLLGYMNTMYGWNYSLANDFSVTGGFKAAMRDMFQTREKAWPGVSVASSRFLYYPESLTV